MAAAEVPCTERTPVVGEEVCTLGSKHCCGDAAGNGDAWVLHPGEVATVTVVDKDGDFKLRNPSGLESAWQLRPKYVYRSKDVTTQVEVTEEPAAQKGYGKGDLAPAKGGPAPAKGAKGAPAPAKGAPTAGKGGPAAPGKGGAAPAAAGGYKAQQAAKLAEQEDALSAEEGFAGKELTEWEAKVLGGATDQAEGAYGGKKFLPSRGYFACKKCGSAVYLPISKFVH